MIKRAEKIKTWGLSYIFAILIVAAATLVFVQGRNYFAKEQWALLYLPLIVFIASRNGIRPAILAAITAFLAWNYFFLPPYHTFHIYDPKDWISLCAFLVVGIIMGMQTGRLKEREALAQARERETALLNTFSAHLVSDISVSEMADFLSLEVTKSLYAGCAYLFTPDTSGVLARIGTPEASVADEHATRLAGESFKQLKESMPPAPAQGGNMVIPLQTAARPLGVLYIGEKSDGKTYSLSEARLLFAIANQAAAFLERKHLQSVEVQADTLREADRMKSIFFSSISHELKTPLASSTATLTNLLESDLTWDESAVREEVSAVLGDLERLNSSISSLVDLSRLESSAWNPAKDWYELGEMLGTVMSRIPRGQRDRIAFLLPDELAPISVDYAQWVRVLSNLIENALAYTDADTKVCVGASAEGGGIRIWVEDQGPGIPPEEKERIFDKFYRGSTSRTAPGTGLGLAIAKEIVRSHGGRIWVEDAEAQGARFVILLPQEDREDEHT